jgi:Zinc finger, C2H2 type
MSRITICLLVLALLTLSNCFECGNVFNAYTLCKLMNQHCLIISVDAPLSVCEDYSPGHLSTDLETSNRTSNVPSRVGHWMRLKQKRKHVSSTSQLKKVKSNLNSNVWKITSDADIHPECSVCHKKFTRLGSLKKHMNIHYRDLETNGENLVKLGDSHCNGMDPTANDEHFNKRRSAFEGVDKKTFACSSCDKKFARIQRLHIHESVHHSGENPPFQCGECYRRFCDPSSLKRHVAVVHSTAGQRKVFSCDQCGKEFNQRTDLRVHTQRHAGVYLHQCSHCGQCFVKRRDYETHMSEEHTAERPHACNVCSKRFAVLGKLKQHERKHEELDGGFKPYSCYECDKQFSAAWSLR